MRSPPWLLAFISSVPLLGCSVADLVNWTTPRHGYTVQRDLAYGPGPRQSLDLYLPDEVRPGSPAVVFLYGGNWDSGVKEDYLFVGQAFASRGYLTAIPDYRVYPEVRFPGFVEDAASATAWVSGHLRSGPRGDAPIVLVGHSAGAQIAALLTLDQHYLAEAGAPVCTTISSTVGLAGPYDFLPLEEERYKRIFPEETRAASQPIAFADGAAPPLLLLVGQDDRTVDPGNTMRLAARIRSAGGRVEVGSYEGIGHVGMIGALARPLRGRAPVLDDIDRFIRAQSARQPPFC